jgi:hypothetical protein
VAGGHILAIVTWLALGGALLGFLYGVSRILADLTAIPHPTQDPFGEMRRGSKTTGGMGEHRPAAYSRTKDVIARRHEGSL